MKREFGFVPATRDDENERVAISCVKRCARGALQKSRADILNGLGLERRLEMGYSKDPGIGE